MGGDHDHSTGLIHVGQHHKPRLIAAFVVIAAFFVVEVVGGFWTGSLALLSDAGHMFTDVLGIGMAIVAIEMASRFQARSDGSPSRLTFGLYRLEILAALANAVLLFVVAGWVVFEAVRRFGDPPEVLGAPMLGVAVLGLVANLVAFALLREGAKESLNVEGAYLEVVADTVGSVGVIVAAVLVQVFGWAWIDPVMGVAIGVWILPRTWRLGRRAVRVLLEAAPDELDLEGLVRDLGQLGGVIEVHDVHVWTVTSQMESASAHLVIELEASPDAVLEDARELVSSAYGIDHVTFQVEFGPRADCSAMAW